MKFLLVYVAISFAVISCADSPGTGDDNTKKKENNSVVQPVLNEQIGNHIKLSFAKDSNSLTTTAHIDSAFSTVICFLEVKQEQHLTASLETNSKSANIRFNQINLPNGNSDGPFGRTIDYDLKGPGLYKLNIGSSMMADSPYVGNFILKLKLK